MIGDTIYAVASPPGTGARGILRLSGPDAFPAAAAALVAPLPRRRGSVETAVHVLGYDVPCLALAMPAPASYTGEDVVELHLPGNPILLDAVAETFPAACRLATPGEFTRRAFERGRLDLSEAEAVLALIHAADAEQSRFAVDVLRGGLAQAIDAVRSSVQDAQAVLEAGLDFTEGETGAVDPDLWLPALRAAHGRCEDLRAGLPETGAGGELLLLGVANAGKSSLANALAGAPAAIVADHPGTTRDVLRVDVGDGIVLLDGPGDLAADADADRRALELRDALAQRVAGVVRVLDGTAPVRVDTDLPVVAEVYTKADLPAAASEPPSGPVPAFVVSSRTGAGLPELRAFLRGQARGGPRQLVLRLRGALSNAAGAIARAIAGARTGTPEELLAVDLQEALDALAEIHGRSSPEDVLDRIFAAFCLGK